MSVDKNFSQKFIYMYFSLTLLIGTIGYAPWVISSYGASTILLSIPFLLLGGASPTLAALITTRMQLGKNGPKFLFKQFGRKETPMKYFAIAVVLQFLIVISSVIMLSFRVGVNYVNLLLLAEFIPILISTFLQNMWEEIGWRGYALPALQGKYSALYSSLIIGLFWAAWHWPHFLVKDSAMLSNYGNFLIFTIMIIMGSIQHTWLYNSSKGNLTVSTLYHSSLNTFGYLFLTKQGIAYQSIPFQLLINILFMLLIILVFKPENLSRTPRQKLFLHKKLEMQNRFSDST